MLSIRTAVEAQAIWKRFNEKYASEQLAPGLSLEQKARYEKRLSVIEAKAYEEKVTARFADHRSALPACDTIQDCAILLQKRWKGLRARDTHIPVKLQGNHSGVFKHLLNKQKIAKSLNQLKGARLKNALDRGDWSDPIFQTQELPFLALSLFSSGKILQHQAYTLFEYAQTLKHYPLKSYQRILDEKGQFTAAAQKYLLPLLKNKNYLKALNEQQLTEFRLLVSTLPLSEQIFYTTATTQKNGRLFDKSLGERLVKLDAMHLQSGSYVHLSSGVRDSAGLARFGFDAFVRAMPRFGKQTIDDIEQGVRNDARYAALAYAKPENYEGLHGWSHVNDTEAEAHDFYHSQIMSSLSYNNPSKTKKGLRAAFLRLIDLTRLLIKEDVKSKWSKEIWNWVDADYTYLFKNDKNTKVKQDNTTYLFCKSLLNVTPDTDYTAGASLINLQPGQQPILSPLGANILIDMAMNQQAWVEIGIDPENLTPSFKDNYNDINAILPHLQAKPPKVQILKLQLYQALKKQEKTRLFSVFSTLIDDHEKNFLAVLKFEKIKKVNTLKFYYKNTEIFSPGGKNKELLDKILKDWGQILTPLSKAIIELNCNEQEAAHYLQELNKGVSEAQALFNAKPTVLGWMLLNPLKTILSFSTVLGIIMLPLYAWHQVNKQQCANQKMREENSRIRGTTKAIAENLKEKIVVFQKGKTQQQDNFLSPSLASKSSISLLSPVLQLLPQTVSEQDNTHLDAPSKKSTFA